MDSAVGMLLEALRETEQADDTLVIYMSDNGRPFPGAKTTLYDEGISGSAVEHSEPSCTALPRSCMT